MKINKDSYFTGKKTIEKKKKKEIGKMQAWSWVMQANNILVFPSDLIFNITSAKIIFKIAS